MKSLVSAAVLAASLCAATKARAWETSTQVGLAEQAALAADLDGWLRSLGIPGGMFESLTVPPDDAPALFEALRNHSPIDGYVPDTRGQQTALAWLLAGAAIADANPTWAANHFFDPWSGKGWLAPRNLLGFLAGGASAPPGKGVPAPDWAASADNPLGLPGFLDQYEKSIRGETPGERHRAMAGTLVAAGALLHVLGDLGSPTHARGDAEAHLAQLGPSDGDDTGSRFERLVAIGWGRLGVPAAVAVPSRPTFRAYFTAPGDSIATGGLAEWSASHWFSEGTLPRAIDIGRGERGALQRALTGSLRRPAPALPARLGLVAATQPDGTILRDARGTCLARYRVERGRLRWWLDDDCELEQAAAILPVTAGYEAALLRWLSRGQLGVATAPSGKQMNVAVTARGLALAAGTVTVLSEDGRGLRTVVGSTPITSALDGGALATATLPADARRAFAVFRGLDGAGEPIVSVGRVDL